MPERVTFTPWSQWILIAVSGVLQIVIFPPLGAGYLAWLALIPLFAALSTTNSFGQAFGLGFVNGLIFYLGTCYWVYHVMHTYGGLNVAISVALTVLFALYMSLWTGLFALVLALMRRRQMCLGGRVLLLSPFVWVACEYGRTEVFGFPWNLLGSAQIENTALSQIATVMGVWGLSFIIAAVSSLIAYGRVFRKNAILAAGFIAMLGLQALMLWRPAVSSQTHSARLVQQNVPILEGGWTQDYFDKTIAEIADISKTKQESPWPRLIIWPESPAPFYTNDPKLRTWLTTLATDRDSFVIAGTLGILPSNKANGYDVYNSATLVAPSGAFTDRYDKVHLVPYGEYVPMRDLFSFAESLTKQVSEFSRGSEHKVFVLKSPPTPVEDHSMHEGMGHEMPMPASPQPEKQQAAEKGNGHKIGVFICYETAFPNEVRDFALKGAEVFSNISNDAWLGDNYGAVAQHLNMARMRAIENRRWILRATNNGITAGIDPYGRIVKQADRNIRTAIDVPFAFETSTTFYTRHGDWFAYLCAIITLAALFVRFRVRAASIS